MTLSTKALALNYICHSPGTHRKEIADHFGIHPNLVSDAIRALIRERWVVEGESKKSSVGRAPVALYPDSGSHAAVSVSYSPKSMTCGLINASGEIIFSTSAAHSQRTPEAVVDLAVQEINKLKKKYKGSIVGLAVADPGMVDHCQGEVVRSSSFPGWRHVPLAKMFKARTGLNTLVTDVTHARAMAQYRILPGRRPSADTMFYVDYGSGTVGFTLLTPQGIWRGEGFAGDVGHVVVDPEGPLCRCGARGCLESRTGTMALENRAAKLLEKGVHSVLSGKRHLTALEIFSAANEGDRLAKTIVRETLADLGLYAAVIIAMFHPRLLVVGAETKGAIEIVTGEIRQAINNRIPVEVASALTVIEGQPTNPLGLAGAGLMLFERVIQFEAKRKKVA